MKVETKFGVFYIEDWEGREEEDRVKLYDSLGRYLDYFSVDSIEETWNGSWSIFAEEIMRGAKKCSSVEEFLDYLGINYLKISKNLEDILKCIYSEDEYVYRDGKYYLKEDNSEIGLGSVLENEWVNKIGEFYILVCD